jgi:hypothetical protein
MQTALLEQGTSVPLASQQQQQPVDLLVAGSQAAVVQVEAPTKISSRSGEEMSTKQWWEKASTVEELSQIEFGSGTEMKIKQRGDKIASEAIVSMLDNNIGPKNYKYTYKSLNKEDDMIFETILKAFLRNKGHVTILTLRIPRRCGKILQACTLESSSCNLQELNVVINSPRNKRVMLREDFLRKANFPVQRFLNAVSKWENLISLSLVAEGVLPRHTRNHLMLCQAAAKFCRASRLIRYLMLKIKPSYWEYSCPEYGIDMKYLVGSSKVDWEICHSPHIGARTKLSATRYYEYRTSLPEKMELLKAALADLVREMQMKHKNSLSS